MHQHASNEAGEHPSNFSPSLRSPIICKVWLTVINTWFLLPTEGDRVISSTLEHGRVIWTPYFPSQWSHLLFISRCWWGNPKPFRSVPMVAYKALKVNIQSITCFPSGFYVCKQLILSGACDLSCGQTRSNCLWSMEEKEGGGGLLQFSLGGTHTSVPPTTPVSHSQLSSSNGTVTERPHTAGEHKSV